MLGALRQGDTESANAYARKSEMLKIRNAPTQFFEGSEAWYEAVAFAEIGDVARLRATLERIDAMAELFATWSATPQIVRGQIQLLRGDAAGALECFNRALSRSGAGKFASWSSNVRGCLEALADLGRVEQARADGARYLQDATDAELTVARIDVHVGLVSVELAARDFAAAAAHLDVVDAIRTSWPFGDVYGGHCHELRAHIAIGNADMPAFERAVRQCLELFARSRNPILLGRAQRLWQDAERSGLRSSKAPTRDRDEDDTSTLATERGNRATMRIDLSEYDRFETRMSKVLSLVAEQVSARHVMLYLLRDNAPTLVAATEHCPAAETMDALVSAFLSDELEESRGATIDPEDVMTTTVDNAAWTGPTGVQFVPALLSHTMRRQLAVTGVLVFDFGSHAHPSDAILSGLSAALTAANDVVPLLVEPRLASTNAL
jgi:hypothetical protein